MKFHIIGLIFLIFAGGCGHTLRYRSPSDLTINPRDPFDKTIAMTKKDRFQADQWLRLGRIFVSVGDYVTAWRYCEYILEYYPDTLYAKEAMVIEDAIADPKKNRNREFIRNNPGLFLGR